MSAGAPASASPGRPGTPCAGWPRVTGAGLAVTEVEVTLGDAVTTGLSVGSPWLGL
jgi:hypothetical protein